MSAQNPDAETMVVILLMAIAILILMLIATFALFRSGARARNGPRSNSFAEKFAELFPDNRKRKASAIFDKAALSPLVKQKLAWVTRIIMFLLLLGSFSFVKSTIRSALHKGWSANAEPESVSFLTVDGRGQVWVVTQGNIVLYPENRESVRIPLPDLSDVPEQPMVSDSVSSLAVDNQDRVWIGTLTARIGIGDASGEWTLYYPEVFGEPFEGLGIWIDRQGQAWTTGPHPAKIHLDVERKIYTLENSGLDNIAAIATDEQGQLWTLTSTGDLKVHAPNGNWEIVAHAKIEDPEAQFSEGWGYTRLAIDQQGQVWIGTGNGVIQMLRRDGVWQTYVPDDPSPAINFTGIVIDDQGQMWGVIGYRGVYRFNPDTGWTAYDTRNSGLPDTTMRSLAIDKQGRVWILTQSGLSIFDPDAGLPVEQVPALSLLEITILPAAQLSLVLLAAWTIIYVRPGRIPTGTPLDFMAVGLGLFSAAVFGLYALRHRQLLADQILDAVLGTAWSFNDAFQFLLFPPLSICLVPLSVIVGAAIGIFVSRLFVQIFRK